VPYSREALFPGCAYRLGCFSHYNIEEDVLCLLLSIRRNVTVARVVKRQHVCTSVPTT
jgi:hypothetical protein